MMLAGESAAIAAAAAGFADQPMPVIDRIADFHGDMQGWRHDIHAQPEMAFHEYRNLGPRRQDTRRVRH
jgi:hypothetical protein